MSDCILTDELKQMNRYWTLLSGVVHEGLAIVTDERLAPDVRLERMRQTLLFAQQYTRVLPPSILAELNVDPAVQAALARLARLDDDPQAAGTAVGLELDNDTVRTMLPAQDPEGCMESPCRSRTARPSSDHN